MASDWQRHKGGMNAGHGTAERLLSLDIVRGFAVMAIVWVNITSFAMPDMAFLSPDFHVPQSPVDRLLWLISFLFMEGKFRGLFTLLFGASMMLVMDRASASGESGAIAHVRRMCWLAIIGLGHYLLLWHGDILLIYALMGLLLTGLHSWSGERLLRWGAALFIAGALWITWLSADRIPALYIALGLGGNAAGLVEVQRHYAQDLAEAQASLGQDMALFASGYGDIVAGRVGKLTNSLLSLPIAALETLPLMMIGAGLYRIGFLTGSWRTEHYQTWLARALPWGLLLTALPAFWIIAAGYDPLLSLAAHLGFSSFGRLLLILAYCAMLLLWVQRPASSAALAARFAAAGRMALSNYLLSSLILTSLFYGYGSGLYAQVPMLGLYGIALALSAAMLLWSPWWMANYRYGPMEWLWRSLARWQVQPFRL